MLLTVDFPQPHLYRGFVTFAFGESKISLLNVGPHPPLLLKLKKRSPKIIESGDVRYHGSAGGKRGWPKGEIKRVGMPKFFTVFEYKAGIANNCDNSRIVRIGHLSP